MSLAKEYLHSFNNVLTVTIGVWLIGPVIMIISILLGGSTWDGFAGGPRRNSEFENSLIGWGLLLTLLGWLTTSVGTAIISGFRSKKDKRYILLPILSLFVPLVLLVFTFILGGM